MIQSEGNLVRQPITDQAKHSGLTTQGDQTGLAKDDQTGLAKDDQTGFAKDNQTGFAKDDQTEFAKDNQTRFASLGDTVQEELQHLTDLRRAYTKRLRVLELQYAQFGLHAPPQIVTEIDHLREQISLTDTQLGTFSLPSITQYSANISTRQVEIRLKGDFTQELLNAAIRAFGAVLDLPPEQIAIMNARPGSVIMTIELPKEAANQLIELYQTNSPIIYDLGIEQLQPGVVFEYEELETFQRAVEEKLGRLGQSELQHLEQKSRDLLVQQPLNFRQLQQNQLDAFSVRMARRIVRGGDFQSIICPHIQKTADDAITLSRIITPVLVRQVAAQKISIPLLPTLFAAIAQVVAQLGTTNLCGNKTNTEKP